ncbi:MAG: T9SS type A sorting domain-containing protein [Bacteroidetes bacterium]|nr:T9SS type A sorting domain-containing protein [Bacteroidota bacterium]
MEKPNVCRLGVFLFLVFMASGLSAQIDTLLLEAYPDTLYAPEANGYEIDLILNDGCVGAVSGEFPLDCGTLTLETVDLSAAAPFGNAFTNGTILAFEPNALWLSLDTIIYLPYSIINDMGQMASSFCVIATGPDLPPPPNICCVQTPCPGELICNPEFSLPVQCDLPIAGNSYLNLDGSGLFPCWRSIQLTPNGNFGPIPSQGECGVIGMWCASNGAHEAMQTTASVVAGQRYLLSYAYLRGGSGASLNHLITGFTNGPIGAVTGPPSYLIQDHQNITNTTRRQMVACFTPDNNYNNLVVYPQQDNSPSFSQPNISLFNMHLQAFPAATQTVSGMCGDPVTLSVPAICIPGGVWTWTDNDGIVVGNNVNSVVVNPTIQNQQYTASLSFPGANLDLFNCTGLDVTFIVLIEGDCCCDDFHDEFLGSGFTYAQWASYQLCAPANILPTDWLSWNFGDGTGAGPVSGQIPCVFHAYPAPGPYLATLTIERILPDGDTCSIELCELIDVSVSCTDCEDHFSQIPSQVDLAVDISNWTPAGGPVNLYPVPVFAPYNVRILWDFDCDGNIDQVTSGNDPASVTYTCGVQTVCYTLECLESQNTACYSEEHVKDFILPCDGNSDFCCADFMTDVMNYGIQETFVGGNTYTYCLSPNIPAGSTIDWDINCDGTDFSGINLCENIVLNPGDTELCATVNYTTADGDNCQVKVNACLPMVEISNDTCTCENPQFQNDINDGFTVVSTGLLTYSFTPVSLIDNCDMVSWIWGDGSPVDNTSGTASISHVFPAADDFFVCMLVTRIDFTGETCTAEYCETISVVTAVTDRDPGLFLSVLPNPSSGNFFVALPVALQHPNNVLRVTNIQGQTVKTVSVSSGFVLIDLSDQPNGMYLTGIYDQQGMMLAHPVKMIKQ